MKETKYILSNNDIFAYHHLQDKLTRYAAQGWHLEKISNLYMKFRRGEPKTVRYEVIYNAEASAYNSQPTEAELELAEICAHAGWELAASFAQVQIYRNEDPDATPLETDEVQKHQNIRRNMMRHMVPQRLLLIVLFALEFLMFRSSLLRNPAATLSSGMSILVLMVTAITAIEFSIDLLGNLLWLRKAGRVVNAGQPIPPNRFSRCFQWVMWSTTALFVLALLFIAEPGYGITVLILSPIVAVASLGTMAITKRLNASKKVNYWVPALVTMVVIFTCTPILFDVLTPAETPVEYPLTLAQLTGESGSNLLNIEVSSSPLASHGRYYDFGSEKQIQYTLVDVHCPLFYDMLLNEQEQNFIDNRHYQGDTFISDELRTLIGADYLRRTATSSEDRWLICWEERILYLYASWPLSDEQAAAMIEVIKPN